MSETELKKNFLEKLRIHFMDIGLSKLIATKVTKLIRLEKIENSTVYLSCDDAFYRHEFFEKKRLEIEKIIKDHWGNDFSFVLTNNHYNKNNKNQKKEEDKKEPAKIQNFSLEKKETLFEKPKTLDTTMNFSNFICCVSNLNAYSACKSVIKSSNSFLNPLFIHSKTGLGKTHLLHSVGNEIQSENKNSKILYVTSEYFVNDIIHKGIRTGKMNEIKTKYINCDVLLIDDIQFFEKKEACQTEFFHIFNELFQKNKKIIITGNKFPKEMTNMDERLKSRFLQGLVVDIQEPGFEDRVLIVSQKSAQMKLNISKNNIDLIADVAKTNIREIEGILKNLLIHKNINEDINNDEYIKKILRKMFPEEEKQKKLNMIDIQKLVSQYFKIKISDLTSKDRHKNYVLARHIAMYLCKELTETSNLAIAKEFGKKDHTTVLHAAKKIKFLIENDDKVKKEVLEIKKELDKS